MHGDIECLDPLARPGRATQELQAGSNAGVVREAADIDLLPQALPAVMRDQLSQQSRQRNAVQRVVGLRCIHRGAILLPAPSAGLRATNRRITSAELRKTQANSDLSAALFCP